MRPVPREHHARRMVAALLRGYDGTPTLLALAAARGLAERLAPAMESPDARPELSSWIDRTARHVHAPEVRAMLGHAVEAIAPLLESDSDRATAAIVGDRLRSAFSAVSENIGAPEPADDGHIDVAISGLIVGLDDCDPASAEHSRAVSLWCRRLAMRLGAREDEVRFAARCGMLHDVGKARTPTAILLAERSLTEDEWTIMRDHTLQGARLIAAMKPLQAFVPAARWHHERLDGQGYPDRLPASEIPRFVRIVSVADAFNAMIGRRPYRLPLTPARALEQLERHRNTQFDPDVVDAMIAVVERPERDEAGHGA